MNTDKLVDHAAANQPVAFKAALEKALSERIFQKIEERKVQIANSLTEVPPRK